MTKIEILGKEYPMRFNVSAILKIADRFGSLEKMYSALDEGEIADKIRNLVWLVALLIEQGCEYTNRLNGTDIKPIDAETMEIVLDLPSITALTPKIKEAIEDGQAQTVETDNKAKN